MARAHLAARIVARVYFRGRGDCSHLDDDHHARVADGVAVELERAERLVLLEALGDRLRPLLADPIARDVEEEQRRILLERVADWTAGSARARG
eukprot:2686718-Prymnesium_polylepis.1